MTLLTLEGREIRLDKDGYLAALDDWSEPVAEALAAREELALTAEHWEILQRVSHGGTLNSRRWPLISRLIGRSAGSGLVMVQASRSVHRRGGCRFFRSDRTARRYVQSK